MQPKLWRDFRVQFTFVVGVPTRRNSDVFHFDGITLTHPSGIVEDPANVWNKVVEESNAFGDILAGDFEDTYYNLTTKTSFIYRWASMCCGKVSPLILMIDDDMAIVPNNMIRLIRSIPHKLKGQLYGGIEIFPPKNMHVVENKWSLSRSEYPLPNFPPYPSGTVQLISYDRLVEMSIAMAFVRPIRVEDAYLGIVTHKLRKPTFKLKQFTIYNVPRDNWKFIAVAKTENVHAVMNWSNGEINV